MTNPSITSDLIELFRSAKANGDPAKYVHVITVEQAHQTAAALSQLTREVDELREALGYTLALARLKYGNLDPDANEIFAKAETLSRSSGRVSDATE